MLMGILIVAGIMTVAAFATSSISDISNTSTQSNQIDIEKKSESMDAQINNTTLSIKNTGKYASEIAMLRFYDSAGNEVHRVVTDDNSGTHIDGSKRHVLDGKLSGNPTLDPHKLIEVQFDNLGLDSVEGLSGEIVTMRGRTFPIDISSDGVGGDSDAGTSTISSIGIGSRIIQVENNGYITHGTGVQGKDESIRPYLPVAQNTDFAATVLNDDTVKFYPINQFWKKYDFDGDDLINVTPAIPNVLGYSASKSMSGSNTISQKDDGINISGTGITVIKLYTYADSLLLRGDLSNADVKLVSSPLDLTTLSMSGNNYIVSQTTPSKQITSSVDHWHSPSNNCRGGCGGGNYGRNHVHQTWDMISNLNVVVAADSDLTASYSTSQSCTGIVRHNQCHDIGRGYNSHGKCYYSECRRSHVHSFSGSGNSVLTTSTVPDGIQITKQTTPGNMANYSTKTHTITSTHPWNEQLHSTENFDQFTPINNSYLVVTLNDGNVTIKGESVNNDVLFLEMDNFTPNIPYQIIKDNAPIVTGMTDENGTIIIDSIENLSSSVGGTLKLYPDSLAYRGSFSTVIFDNLNHQTIHIDTKQDRTYVVHAYGSIPILGNVTVTNMNLDGTLELPYLNKNYALGDSIQAPVIPGYYTINFEVNGIAASLQYGDILGSTGITIADPSSNTIKTNSPDSTISSAESISGTTAYAIATTQGNLKAIISETISGDITITNTYHLEQIPPPPLPPGRIDPLSGYVDVFVNGILVKEITLGINPYPNFTPSATAPASIVTRSVTYSYPDYTLSGAVSVPVNPGDVVEFFVYGKIHGDIDGYSTPAGYNLVSSSGKSTATVTIRSASIQTSN